MKTKFILFGCVSVLLPLVGYWVWSSNRSNVPPTAGSTADAAIAHTPPAFQSEEEPVNHSPIGLITDKSDSVPFSERYQAVRNLPDSLTPEDCRQLMDYLHDGPNNSLEYGIKNDIMNKLRNQKVAPAGLTEFFLTLAGDSAEDTVVRSYATQHLRPWYEKTKDERIRTLYQNLAGEQQHEVSGCALLALRHLTQNYPEEFNQQQVLQQAQTLCDNPAANALSKASAIQVAVLLGDNNVSRYRSLAENQSNSLPVRLASIAALGQIQDASAVPWLNEMSAAGGPLAKAADRALQILTKTESIR